MFRWGVFSQTYYLAYRASSVQERSLVVSNAPCTLLEPCVGYFKLISGLGLMLMWRMEAEIAGRFFNPPEALRINHSYYFSLTKQLF